MNSRWIKRVGEEEAKEIEQLFNSASLFRKHLIELLEEDLELAKTKALSLSPTFFLQKKYVKLTSDIKAINNLISLLK